MLQSTWPRKWLIQSFCVISCHCVTFCHFLSFYVILCHFILFYVILCHIMSFYVILCHCLILCRAFPYFCLIPRHDDNQQDHFMSFCVVLCHFLSFYVIHLSFVLFIVSNIPRHDVTINMIEEMTATVVQLQEENRYVFTLTFYNPICRNWSSVHSFGWFLIISINYSDGTENIRFVTIKEDPYDDGMFSGGPGTVYNDSQYTIIQGIYEILLPFFPGEGLPGETLPGDTLPSPRRPSLGALWWPY